MASFFGLTSLGPQSPFASQYARGVNISLFDLAEVMAAFDSESAKHGGVVRMEQLDRILHALFHGPAPEHEHDRIARAFEAAVGPGGAADRTTFEELVRSLQQSSDEAVTQDRARAAHFVSRGMLRELHDKHVRSEHGPRDVFAQPMTLTQEIGWRARDAPIADEKRHSRKQCAETKFAAALASSGYL